MKDGDIRFSSLIISMTSVLYGISSIIRLLNSDNSVVNQSGGYYYIYYALFFMLIILGTLKMSGMMMNNRVIRKVSIVSLMFVWGFLWTSSLIEFFTIGANSRAILMIPIIAISAYIAIRGDYS